MNLGEDVMRRFSTAFALALAALLAAGSALAQDYPNRPIRMVVPFPPGGSIDIVARAIVQHWAPLLNQQIVVDNRGGAGGTIGTGLVARANADGYTMLYGNLGPLSIGPHLYRKLGYDLFKDLAPVSQTTSAPFMIFASTGLPVNTAAELIAYAKQRPGELNYASSGVGSGLHLTGELFKNATGLDIVHVPFKGLGQAVPEIASGRIQLVVSTVASMVPHVKAGRLKGIVSTGARRSPALPDVPTCIEAGLPQLESTAWHAVVVPTGTPAPAVRKLQQTLVTALSRPELRTHLMESTDADVVGSSPAELARFLRDESGKWGKIIRTLGVTAD
jgi:tripartite-type tricarboxylate transporter receptor subunit TctC